jgi:predicted acetyltransferase
MRYDVRELTGEDGPASWELGRLAFGGPRQQPAGWAGPDPARLAWGAFDRSGRLVAKAVDRRQEHWFGGRLVPASGVAGVVVAADLRGRGVIRQVIAPLLAAARARGAVISTLFDSTPVPYRRLGWEEVGALTWRTLPTLALARIRPPAHIRLRPAVVADVPAVLELYRTVARVGSGLMDRSGPAFDTTPETVLAAFDGITLAHGSDGTLQGYASWDRGTGRDAAARLSVYDLIGLTAEATTALLGMLAGWASVVHTLELRLPDPDPAFLLSSFVASSAGAQVRSRQPWMLRLIDAPAAIAARGWPPLLDGAVDVLLDDEVCPWNSGPHRLVLSAGSGRLEPGGSGSVRLSMRGFALLYAGVGGPALLRRAGLLDGGDANTDAFLQAAAAGPAPALLDYF